MHACGYPIYHTIGFSDEGYKDYEIYIDGEKIYSGRVYPFSSGGSVEVDIAPVCREYLDTSFEDYPLLSGTCSGTVGLFVVSNTNDNTTVTYPVCYNYNTDYLLDIAEGTLLNAPLTDYVDPRQYIGTSILTGGGITASHNRPVGEVGGIITAGDYDFKILPECNNRYALYYVNKNGGLDYLICSGKAVDKYNAKRTDAKVFTDFSNRRLFSNKRINQSVSKLYELNTGYISQQRAQNIDHFIFSPKVWIHNLEEDTISSCRIDDNSCSAKRFRNDGMINYTINVTESQSFIRK